MIGWFAGAERLSRLVVGGLDGVTDYRRLRGDNLPDPEECDCALATWSGVRLSSSALKSKSPLDVRA